MKLLIKRDPTYLVKTQGKAELDSDIPAQLNDVRVVDLNIREEILERDDKDDSLIFDANDNNTIDSHLNTPINGTLPAIWSGHRSVLISDGNNGFYRIKGVALNPKKPEVNDIDDEEYHVFGGQPKYSAEFEKDMSDKFNKILQNEGIDPIMICKGFWHYPTKVRGNKYSASIIKTEGDTRLDEFMNLLEGYLLFRMIDHRHFNDTGNNLYNNMKLLYKNIGFVIGRLKNLMDKNNQTWSTGEKRNNAHIGNIVLYNGNDKVKVGFVDFDASCSTDDFSLKDIKRIQQEEYKTIINSAKLGPISPRPLNMKFFKNFEPKYILTELRDEFIKGYSNGYYSDSTNFSNAIDIKDFSKIFKILRSNACLYYIKYGLEEYLGMSYIKNEGIPKYGLEDILYKNNNYQNYIKTRI